MADCALERPAVLKRQGPPRVVMWSPPLAAVVQRLRSVSPEHPDARQWIEIFFDVVRAWRTISVRSLAVRWTLARLRCLSCLSLAEASWAEASSAAASWVEASLVEAFSEVVSSPVVWQAAFWRPASLQSSRQASREALQEALQEASRAAWEAVSLEQELVIWQEQQVAEPKA